MDKKDAEAKFYLEWAIEELSRIINTCGREAVERAFETLSDHKAEGKTDLSVLTKHPCYNGGKHIRTIGAFERININTIEGAQDFIRMHPDNWYTYLRNVGPVSAQYFMSLIEDFNANR